ncbi:MAG: putative nucleotidyltransferase [Thermoproteota archaeon]|jgi:predicted nucleotidyltransferase
MIKKYIQKLLVQKHQSKIIQNVYSRYVSIIKKKIINELPNNEIYLKGSFSTDNWVAGISDIDLIIIITNDQSKENVISTINTISNQFSFPIDIEVYAQIEFDFLMKFSTARFLESNNWIPLNNSTPITIDYIYYPQKYSFDLILEIFSQLEWVQRISREFYLNKTEVNRIRLERIILKLFRYLYSFESMNSFTLHSDLIIRKKYEGVIQDLMSQKELESFLVTLVNFFYLHKKINSFYNSLGPEYSKVVSSVKEEYNEYGKVCSFSNEYKILILNDKCKYRDNNYKLVLNDFLFDVFYKVGCFSIDVIQRYSMFTKNKFGSLLFKQLFYAKLIEGKYSWVAEQELDLKVNTSNFEELLINESKIFKAFYDIKFSSPLDIIDKTIYITVNWGAEKQRKIAFERSKREIQKQNEDFFHLHINLDFDNEAEFIHEENYLQLTLNGSSKHLDLWHKETLYNIAGYFSFGAGCLIFADSDIYCDDHLWLKNIKSECIKTDFVQGFRIVKDTLDDGYNAESWIKKYLEGEEYYRAPGLIWGMRGNIFQEIEGLPDNFPEGSGDGALVRELTGVKLSFIDNFEWFTSNLRDFKNKYSLNYIDAEVVHINHGKARDYVNRSVFLNFLNVPLESIIEKDYFGALSWKTDNELLRSPLHLKDYIFDYSRDRFLHLFSDLLRSDILKVPSGYKYEFFSPSPHSESISMIDGSYGFIFPMGYRKYEVEIPKQENDNIKFSFSYGDNPIKPNSVNFLRYKIEGNIAEKNVDLFTDGLRLLYDIRPKHIFNLNSLNFINLLIENELDETNAHIDIKGFSSSNNQLYFSEECSEVFCTDNILKDGRLLKLEKSISIKHGKSKFVIDFNNDKLAMVFNIITFKGPIKSELFVLIQNYHNNTLNISSKRIELNSSSFEFKSLIGVGKNIIQFYFKNLEEEQVIEFDWETYLLDRVQSLSSYGL